MIIYTKTKEIIIHFFNFQTFKNQGWLKKMNTETIIYPTHHEQTLDSAFTNQNNQKLVLSLKMYADHKNKYLTHYFFSFVKIRQ